MTIKHSGMISFTELNAETNHAANDLGSYRGKTYWFDNGLEGSFPSGTAISFGAMYDKRFTDPGTQSALVCDSWQLITSNTTYVVPNYEVLTVIGIGGGGSADTNLGSSGAGRSTSFGSYCSATGGANGTTGGGGAGGTGIGGDTNYTGGTGTMATGTIMQGSGTGGSGGAAGGYGILNYAGAGGPGQPGINAGAAGSNYGGGGSGSWKAKNYGSGSGGGGGGGAFYKVFNKTSLPPGTNVAIVIGAGGASSYTGATGNGAPGVIAIQRCYYPVVPGNVSYTVPGSYDFIVPQYNFLTVEMWGGGGSGGNNRNPNPGGGYTGTASTFLSLSAGGGGGGGSYTVGNYNGLGGKAVGGDINYDGETGQNVWPYSGRGGNAGGYSTVSGSGAGSAGGQNNITTAAGGSYGGGSGGVSTSNGGGGGAYVKKTYAVSATDSPVPNTKVTFVVGAGAQGRSSTYSSGAGGNGAVLISWN